MAAILFRERWVNPQIQEPILYPRETRNWAIRAVPADALATNGAKHLQGLYSLSGKTS